MFPTRTCPRCGNHVWGTMDRCPVDGTPLGAEAVAPGPRPASRVSQAQPASPPRSELPKATAGSLAAPPPRTAAAASVLAPPPKAAVPAPVTAAPPKKAAAPAPKVAPPAKLNRATDLTVDIPDERPADKGRRSDDLNVFDSLAKPGSGADGRASALDDSMGPPRNRAGKSGRVALFLIVAVVGASLAAWALLRPAAKAPAPVPIAAPAATPSPPPPAAPLPAPVAPAPTQAAAPAPASPPTTPPAPAKTTTSIPASAPPKTPAKAAAPARGKSAAPRPRPSSRLYGVPVPAEFMPKNP